MQRREDGRKIRQTHEQNAQAYAHEPICARQNTRIRRQEICKRAGARNSDRKGNQNTEPGKMYRKRAKAKKYQDRAQREEEKDKKEMNKKTERKGAQRQQKGARNREGGTSEQNHEERKKR